LQLFVQPSLLLFAALLIGYIDIDAVRSDYRAFGVTLDTPAHLMPALSTIAGRDAIHRCEFITASFNSGPNRCIHQLSIVRMDVL
jgi:hypothetical protein